MFSMLVDNALPLGLYQELNERLHHTEAPEIASYGLGAHRYHSFWFSLRDTPRTLIEHAIVLLASQVPCSSEFEGVEWWTLSVPAGRGLAWHFDMDLEKSRRKVVVHPSLSSVLYLGDAGGPTIIVDQRLTSSGERVPATPGRGMAYLPAPNRFGAFDGGLRHAVAGLDAASASATRRSLLVNWWRSKPEPSPGSDGLQACVAISYEDPYFEAVAARDGVSWDDAENHIPVSPIFFDGSGLSGLAERENCPIWPHAMSHA